MKNISSIQFQRMIELTDLFDQFFDRLLSSIIPLFKFVE